MSSFLDLAPGETNFIGSRPLTQSEADLLYFPIDGDIGGASFGVSAQDIENAIQAAIQNYRLLSKPEADQLYLGFETDFQPQIEEYQIQLNSVIEQELNSFSTSIESLIDSRLTWDSISDKPSFDALYRAIGTPIGWAEVDGIPATFTPALHTHTWENITDPPTTATRWSNWNEVTGKPDFNTLYRQLGVAIDWSEISNPPAFSSDWNSITGKPSTYPPSTHGHDWQEISGMPSYATAADINSAIQQHRDSPDGTQHRWEQISGTPDFASPTNPTFSFLTGWTHYFSSWEVSCRAIGRLVKWGGLAHRTTTSGNIIIGAMPSQYYRPAKRQMFMSWAYWAGEYHAVRLDVNTFGSVSIAYPTPPTSVIDWVSLAPICYYASA